jgi:hypothetical protein
MKKLIQEGKEQQEKKIQESMNIENFIEKFRKDKIRIEKRK